eukprot:TRINITY_DN4589_c0_g1_i1.p1 TRINITY_DN4589_c0_g1~~TRINITY_DN4589_c0_g1_i1.p1  ORF type:complete len:159 (-),score=11.34 TRINITY_DN4589_c0_g1_i1:27-452(-)
MPRMDVKDYESESKSEELKVDGKKEKVNASSGGKTLPPLVKSSMAGRDPLTVIVERQLYDGSWSMEDVCGLLEDKFEAREDLKSQIWATVIMLAYLERKFADRAVEWKLVAQKARKMIKVGLPATISFEDLLEQAKKILTK